MMEGKEKWWLPLSLRRSCLRGLQSVKLLGFTWALFVGFMCIASSAFSTTRHLLLLHLLLGFNGRYDFLIKSGSTAMSFKKKINCTSRVETNIIKKQRTRTTHPTKLYTTTST
jgi:hypothetical protein